MTPGRESNEGERGTGQDGRAYGTSLGALDRSLRAVTPPQYHAPLRCSLATYGEDAARFRPELSNDVTGRGGLVQRSGRHSYKE
jgi:hypothetical protein